MDVSADDIHQAVKLSGLKNYTGIYKSLGEGEINNSFLLDCGDNKYVLRIAKDANQRSLIDESSALKLLKSNNVPRLIYFNENTPIKNRLWVIETYVNGILTKRLSVSQFESLGKILAAAHAIQDPTKAQLNLWEHFLDACRSFGTEEQLLNHENSRLRALVNTGQKYMQAMQYLVDGLQLSLIHGDATPSNILVDGEVVNLIDWEFARFSDPMREFSTVYYDDIEYNQGKWRIKITPPEKTALFNGYKAGGGELNEQRINFWMNFDKLGAAVFLYWRLNESKRETPEAQAKQYQLDLDNLSTSLENNMP